ncbi:MAG: cytochrome c [Gemmataceae bacterium]|nr:cytochrome c [Gemmataceae bacterium]
MTVSRTARVAPALLLGLAGCGPPPEYPPDLAFPARADRLVLRVPTAQPAGPTDPGPLDAVLAGLDARGGKTLDPAAAPPEAREALARFLAETFGTPAAPTVAADGAADLGLTPDRLAEGGRLYRRSCQHCHGLAGDGQGPSGLYVTPRPRDYRRGAFKFVSSGDGGKPRRDDLRRTIRDGLKGTAMPSFALLPDDRRELMADFVVYLGLRGEVEYRTVAAVLADDGDGTDGDPTGFARDRLADIFAAWRRAEDAPPGPPPPADDPDAVRRGYELFTAAGKTDCLSCHEDFGRKPTYRYDVWGTAARPKELTEPGYKGGDRPENLYHRIRHGIQPVGMPAHPTLTDSQIWDLVRFVRALPYPRELPDDIRAKVYAPEFRVSGFEFRVPPDLPQPEGLRHRSPG